MTLKNVKVIWSRVSILELLMMGEVLYFPQSVCAAEEVSHTQHLNESGTNLVVWICPVCTYPWSCLELIIVFRDHSTCAVSMIIQQILWEIWNRLMLVGGTCSCMLRCSRWSYFVEQVSVCHWSVNLCWLGEGQGWQNQPILLLCMASLICCLICVQRIFFGCVIYCWFKVWVFQ